MSVGPDGAAPDDPGGEDALGSYEWLQRGMSLLEEGHAAAAATVLERVAADEPRSASVLEALGRAQFTAGRPGAAVKTFERLADLAPDSDYARFGYGQSLRRIGRLPQAAEQLALAVAMRPHRTEYVEALARVRALIAPRQEHGDGAATAGPGVPAEDLDPGLVVLTREPGQSGPGGSGPARGRPGGVTADADPDDAAAGDAGTGGPAAQGPHDPGPSRG